MGTLYIVSTPIGNLQDITLRALRTLFEVDTIFCEDTRRTGILLSSLRPIYDKLVYQEERGKSKPKLISYFEQNELRRIPEALSLIHNDEHIALVSGAGTPAISDPGFKLIRECIREKIKVEIVPGPSAVIAGLTASGLPTDKFLFLGYPPKKLSHRLKLFRNVLENFKTLQVTVVLYEAPHKLTTTLENMLEVFGDREITICRELTKIHEEIFKDLLSKATEKYQNPKGEFVILLHP